MENTEAQFETYRDAVCASMQFETDQGQPLQIDIFIDWSTVEADLWIMLLRYRDLRYDHVLADVETVLQADDSVFAQKMAEISRREWVGDTPDQYFRNHGIRIGKEIISERTIYYMGSKSCKWADFPGRLKELFEAAK